MKKIFLFVFSLIMMCSVSFAYYVTPNITYKGTGTNNSSSSNTYLGTSYTVTEVKNILKYLYADKNNETYISNFNDLTSQMTSLGYKWLVIDDTKEFILFSSYENDVELAVKKAGSSYYVGALFTRSGSSPALLWRTSNSLYYKALYYYASSGTDTFCYYNTNLSELNIYACNCDIYTDLDTTNTNFVWDGESYFYKSSEQGGSGGINLTDEEIAEVVTRFVNSEAYLTNNKANYNDFFITYDNLTEYYRAYTYHENMDLAINYGNYTEEGEFVTTGTEEGEAWQIRPYVFDGNIFKRLYDWLASKYNNVSFEYYSISPDSSINPRYVGYLEHSYCSNYRENEVVVYSTKQIRYLGEKTNDNGEIETEVIDDYIPKTVLKDSVTGEEIIIQNNFKDSSDSLENIITPNADFSGLKQAFEKYISFVNISSITWLATAISSMITIFIPFVALGIILFLINRILNGGS